MKRATLLMIFLFSAKGFAGFRHFEQGEAELGFAGNYFRSNANYSSSGDQVNLGGDRSYQNLELDLSSRMAFGGFWALRGDMLIGNAESNGADATRANSSLTGASVGAEVLWSMGDLDFVPSFEMYFPFEKVSASQDTVMNSEGVSESRFALTLQSRFEGFQLDGKIGYTQRGDARASLMPWSVGVEFPKPIWSYGAELKGYQPMSHDADKDSASGEAARAATSARVNGGSLRYYGIDPSLVEANGVLKMRWSHSLTGFATAGMTLAGQNSASGFQVGIGLVYNFNSKPLRKRKTYDSQLSVDPYLDQFEEDTQDGVDQKLFRAEPKPEPSTPSETSTPSSPAAPSRAAQKENVQKKLDETEMMIELKVNPKKNRRNKR